MPSMKFASGFEILEYCQSMAEKFGFYEHCLFHTTVEQTEWDEETGRWTVTTDRGDAMRARFVILANGILTSPKLARIDGMETYQGEAFHTSRWNYDIDLQGKTIGIIGTGATAVQAIPELAKVAKDLYVFQRTPSTIDVRDQRETTDEEREAWAERAGLGARPPGPLRQDLGTGRTAIQANDDYLAGKVADFKERKEHATRLSHEELVQKQLDSNFRIMEQIRARVDAIVEDPVTAEALKPYYPYGCKRPTFHDEYLPTFNRPNVHLVDTAPIGVIRDQRARRRARRRRVPARRPRVRDRLHVDGDVDVQHGHRARGRSLSEKWSTEGTKTFLGLHSRGFPNLFIVTGPQGGGGSFNFTDAIDTHGDYVVWMLSTMRDERAPDRRRRAGARGRLRRALPRGRHRHRAAARLHLVLQRPRRGVAREPRLLRRRQLAQVAHRRPGVDGAVRVRARSTATVRRRPRR